MDIFCLGYGYSFFCVFVLFSSVIFLLVAIANAIVCMERLACEVPYLSDVKPCSLIYSP